GLSVLGEEAQALALQRTLVPLETGPLRACRLWCELHQEQVRQVCGWSGEVDERCASMSTFTQCEYEKKNIFGEEVLNRHQFLSSAKLAQGMIPLEHEAAYRLGLVQIEGCHERVFQYHQLPGEQPKETFRRHIFDVTLRVGS